MEYIVFEMLIIVFGYMSMEFKEFLVRDKNVGVFSISMVFKF